MTEEQGLDQALAELWGEVARTHFLQKQTSTASQVLKRRREAVWRLLSLEERQPTMPGAGAAPLMLDHFYTMLKAESAWLDRALARLDIGLNSQNQC